MQSDQAGSSSLAFECEWCGARFPTLDAISRHKRASHLSKQRVNFFPPGTGPRADRRERGR